MIPFFPAQVNLLCSLSKMLFRQAGSFLSKLKKTIEMSEKGTLMVPFHTFPPSEIFKKAIASMICSFLP